jgi:predicted secreted acid phosphatase
MTPCYIVDIDGTVANIEHRLHFIQSNPKDWDAFFKACVNDKPIAPMFRLLHHTNFGSPRSTHFIYVTGRPEKSREDTMRWLAKPHILDVTETSWVLPHPDKLYMRKDGDRREDFMVKREILTQLRADGYEPILAFDDRTQVVKMWREEGIQCLQVADGNY